MATLHLVTASRISPHIADYPSYLHIIPQQIDHITKALQLAQLVKQMVETGQ